ncbi:hypothetical protein [Streptomyces griseus]|nr:hypothetical protein [Streptomyces griseus]
MINHFSAARPVPCCAERYFQVTESSGVIVQFIEWVTPPSPENT